MKYAIGFVAENGEFFALSEYGFANGDTLTVDVPHSATIEEIKQAFADEFGIDDEFLAQCDTVREARHI